MAILQKKSAENKEVCENEMNGFAKTKSFVLFLHTSCINSRGI